MIMLDTDIIIWVLRGKAEIKQKFDRLVVKVKGEVYVTPVQTAEIYAGIRQSEYLQTENFFQALHQIDINEEIGKKAGDFMRTYSKSHNVTLADALIAAVSELHHLKIWTLNKKHYPMITKENFVK